MKDGNSEVSWAWLLECVIAFFAAYKLHRITLRQREEAENKCGDEIRVKLDRIDTKPFGKIIFDPVNFKITRVNPH